MKKSMFTAFALGLCLTASVMAQVPSYVPSNGLVGWWPFNGNANDESGNGNNGTVNGATLTTDRFGVANKAYSFDGNDWITIANTISGQINNSVTISSWINVNSWFSNTYFPVLSNTDQTSTFGKFGCYLRNNGAWSHFGNQETGFGTSYILNTWYHIVFTIQNGIFSFYVNGQLILSGPPCCTISGFGFNNNLPLLIGKDTPGITEYSNGKIDDIGIWNRALNDCEIQDLYNSQINSVSGSISVSPQLATIGSSVLLSTSSQTQNVQWQSNPSNFGWQNVPSNANYSGGTSNSLTVSNVQLSNHNQPFRVIASAANCTDTSNVASILIADTCITNVTVYDTLYTTVTDTLIINTTLSLPAPNNENTILIYPNPAIDHITIDNGNFAAMAGYTIKIENNAGQQVFQSAINQAQFYVDLSTWTGNGLYFVHLIDPQNNTVTVRKIVLQ